MSSKGFYIQTQAKILLSCSSWIVGKFNASLTGVLR